MKKLWVVLGLLPFLCCLFGVLVALPLMGGTFNRWESLGTPPGGAVEILDADAGLVLIKNSAGEVYRCPECWQQAELFDERLLDNQYDCTRDVSAPEPPGNVIFQFSDFECYADGSTYFHYVVLDDGSVWEWSHTGSWVDIIVPPFFGVVGCLTGIFIAIFGAVIFKLYSLIRDRNSTPPHSVAE